MEGHFDNSTDQGGSLSEGGLEKYDTIIYVDFPKKYKRRWIDSFDKRFVAIWLITFFVQVSLTYYFTKKFIAERVKPAEIQQIQQQFARLVLKKEVKEKPVQKKKSALITPEETTEENENMPAESHTASASGNEATAAPAERNERQSGTSTDNAVTEQVARGENPYHVPVGRGHRTPQHESFRIISKNVADKGILGFLGSTSEKATGKAVRDILNDADKVQGKFEQTLGDVGSINHGKSAAEEMAQREQRVRRKETTADDADIRKLIADRQQVASANVSRQKTYEKQRQTTVKQKEPQLVGHRNPDDISAIVSKHNAAIQACYQRELRRNPDLKGKIVVRFTIAASGAVTHVELVSSTLNNGRVERCVLSRIRRWDDFGVIDASLGDTTFRQVYTFGY